MLRFSAFRRARVKMQPRARDSQRQLHVEGLEPRWALAFGAEGIVEAVPASEPATEHAVELAAGDLAWGDLAGPAARLTASRGRSAPAIARALTTSLTLPALRSLGVSPVREARIAPVAAAPPPAASATPRGDINGDGQVSRADLAVLVRNLGRSTDAMFTDGDLTGDGAVGLADLASIVFGPGAFQITAPPAVTDDDTPDVTWSASIGAVAYDVTIATVADCSGGVVQSHAGVTGTTLTLGALPDGVYYACVTARNVDGQGADAANNGLPFEVATPPSCSLDTGFPPGWTVLGDACLHPINHASFVLRWNGLTIYNDPVGGGALYTGFPKADVILVSHSHSDHYSATTISEVADTDPNDGDGVVRIVTSQTVFNLSSFTAWHSSTTVLGYGANTDIRGLNVAAVHAYNGNHALNTGNGYVVTLDGYRLYISGDTGAVAEIRALDDIDAAVVCMNVPFTMTVDEAASVVRDIQPGVVIPYHYRNTSTSFADLNRFRTLVGTDLGIEVRLLDWY